MSTPTYYARTTKANTDDECAAAVAALKGTGYSFRFVRQMGAEKIQIYELANEANSYII